MVIVINWLSAGDSFLTLLMKFHSFSRKLEGYLTCVRLDKVTGKTAHPFI